MPDLAADLDANWRWIDAEWTSARDGWRDDSATEFENYFWGPLESETHAITEEADRLLGALAHASEVARQR